MKIALTVFVLCLVCASSAFAQWTKCDGPTGSYLNCFDVNGKNLVAVSQNYDFYFWDNSTGNWSEIVKPIKNNGVICLASNGDNLYAGTYGGVMFSTDKGRTWTTIYKQITGSTNINSIATEGNNIYAGMYGGISLSNDNGMSWVAYPNPLLAKKAVGILKISGKDLYAATEKGLLLSNDSAVTWSEIHNGLPDTTIRSIAVNGSTLFVGTAVGLYHSSDKGHTWGKIPFDTVYGYINSVLLNGANVFVGTDRALIVSKDNGATWLDIHTGYNSTTYFGQLAANGDKMFANTSRGMLASSNNGVNWSAINSGLTNCYVPSIVVNGTNIYAIGGSTGLSVSKNNGVSWNPITIGLPYDRISSVVASNTHILVSTDRNVLRSTDNGFTWNAIDTIKQGSYFNVRGWSGEYLFATGLDSGVYRSIDNGENWIVVNNGLPKTSLISTFLISGTNLFISTKTGVYLSTDNGANWIERNTGIVIPAVYSITKSGENLYAAASSMIYRSTNNGTTWVQVKTTFYSYDYYGAELIASGSSLFAAVDEDTKYSIYRSSDNGDTWSKVSEGMAENAQTISLATSGTTLFAGTFYSGLWKLDLTTLDATDNNKTAVAANRLSYFPNPATTTLTINSTSLPFNEFSPVTYTLSTLTGNKLMQFEQTEKQFSVSLNGIASGVYALSAAQGGKRAVVMVTVVE